MKRKKPSKPSPSFGNPEIQQIEQLFQFVTEHKREEFEYSGGDLSIRLRKPSAGVVVSAPRMIGAPEIIVPGSMDAPQMTSGGAAAPAAESRSSEDLHLVKSPIVGTYYESPSPGTEAFVKAGTYVETGKILCIVDAMKLLNEIESDVTAEVIPLFVENSQPPEYAQPLLWTPPTPPHYP